VIFTARRYVSAVWPCLRLSVRFSATSRSSTKLAKCTMKLTVLHNISRYLYSGAKYLRETRYCTPVMGSIIWPIDSCHVQWPWMTLKVIRLLKGFSNAIRRRTFVRHFDTAHFDWHSTLSGPSATVELLVGELQQAHVTDSYLHSFIDIVAFMDALCSA